MWGCRYQCVCDGGVDVGGRGWMWVGVGGWCVRAYVCVRVEYVVQVHMFLVSILTSVCNVGHQVTLCIPACLAHFRNVYSSVSVVCSPPSPPLPFPHLPSPPLPSFPTCRWGPVCYNPAFGGNEDEALCNGLGYTGGGMASSRALK